MLAATIGHSGRGGGTWHSGHVDTEPSGRADAGPSRYADAASLPPLALETAAAPPPFALETATAPPPFGTEDSNGSSPFGSWNGGVLPLLPCRNDRSSPSVLGQAVPSSWAFRLVTPPDLGEGSVPPSAELPTGEASSLVLEAGKEDI
ncbi:UNVERIFIED_CONTAM: hypothetical protein FKN15_000826 [Acipenser sinensis]